MQSILIFNYTLSPIFLNRIKSLFANIWLFVVLIWTSLQFNYWQRAITLHVVVFYRSLIYIFLILNSAIILPVLLHLCQLFFFSILLLLSFLCERDKVWIIVLKPTFWHYSLNAWEFGYWISFTYHWTLLRHVLGEVFDIRCFPGARKSWSGILSDNCVSVSNRPVYFAIKSIEYFLTDVFLLFQFFFKDLQNQILFNNLSKSLFVFFVNGLFSNFFLCHWK